jgi:hypothetical protein
MALAPHGPTNRARAALQIADLGRGMLVRQVSVAAPDVVFVKGILEASEGIAGVFSERGGELSIVAPPGREEELGELLADLARDVGAIVDAAPVVET